MSEWWNNSPYQTDKEPNQNPDMNNQVPEQTPSNNPNSVETPESKPETPVVDEAPKPIEEPAASDTGITAAEETATASEIKEETVNPATPNGASFTPPQTTYTQTPFQQPQQPQPQQPWQAQQTPPQQPWGIPPYQRQPNPVPPMPQRPQNNKPAKDHLAAIILIALAVICIISLLVGIALLVKDEPSAAPTTSETSSVSDKPSVNIQSTEIKDGGLSTAEIVKKNLDSTVVINMYSNETITYGGFSFGNQTEEKQAGTASGIIMSADGYIITNQHCVVNEQTHQPYARLEVILYSGATYSATIIGEDEDTDLAVIKINATGLQPAEFGDSEKINIGDRVITIGNAGGLQWSASQGILSGKDRDVYDKTGYSIQCLQIDAAINPGNSGGPLINCMGQVIGINSAKIVYSGYENLGFSIPINEAKPLLDDFIKYGYVTGRVELGITGYTVTQTGYEGFMVYTIEEDSCLKGTAIQQYDIITAINGTKVTSRTELRNALSKFKAGDTVKLTILRITNKQLGTTENFDVPITLKEAR